MTRFGLFGGSFDPPHMAHVMAGVWALLSGEIDRLMVVPAARHAFGKKPAAEFADRLRMCELAFAFLPPGAVEVSGIEGERKGVSYTAETLRQLAARHPDSSWRLIAGSDISGDLPKWRESEFVLSFAPPLIIPRLDASGGGIERHALPAISSTWVREQLAAGNHEPGLVPAAVRDYILAHRLYGADPPAGG